VIQKVGVVAYHLELPSDSVVHPVFHVLQLQKAIGVNVQVTPELPDQLSHLQIPEKILQHRLITQGVRPVLQVLVKWSTSPASLATWEDLEALCWRFPGAPAWGQAACFGGGNVRDDDSLVEIEDTEEVGPEYSSVSKRVCKPNPTVVGSEWVNV
jgi:hypothetical protein